MRRFEFRLRRRRFGQLVMGLLAALLALSTLASLAAGQTPPKGFADNPEALEVKLVTFGTGPAIHQYFGHNALWVYDRDVQWGALWNYGMFSFGPDMLPKYMKGKLTFWVEPTPVRRTFEFYRDMGRSVSVQALNLEPAVRKRVADRLMHDALPENRYYQYHHYHNNCSTKLRDVLDGALDGRLRKAWSTPARFTYRGHTRRYAERSPVVNLALMFWMNDSMEAPIERWHETFLPQELADGLADFEYVNSAGQTVPLVDKQYVVYPGEAVVAPEVPSPTWIGAGLVGIALGLVALGLGLWRRRSQGRGPRVLEGLFQALIGLVFGIPGLLGFLMWTLTEHMVTYNNENQLLANPITFALLPLGIMVAWGSRFGQRAVRLCAYALAAGGVLSLVLKVLPAFDQDIWIPMALLLPMNLGLAAGQWLQARAHAEQGVSRPAPESGAPVGDSVA